MPGVTLFGVITPAKLPPGVILRETGTPRHGRHPGQRPREEWAEHAAAEMRGPRPRE